MGIKLKDLGILPEKIKYPHIDCNPDGCECCEKDYNDAIDEIGEIEICLDEEKIIKIILDTLGTEYESEENYALNTMFKEKIIESAKAISQSNCIKAVGK
jgi:hypothetical protein